MFTKPWFGYCRGEGMRLLFKPLFIAISILSVAILPLAAGAEESVQLTSFEEVRVVDLRAGQLKTWLAKPVEKYSLMAVRKDRLKPIAFQFNEMDVAGEIYFEETGVELAGELNIVDPEDELLFMLSDAGPRRSASTKLAGTPVAEIEIKLNSGASRFVYIVRDSRLRSNDSYVRYQFDYHRVETDYYTLTHSADNAIHWEDFQHYPYTGDRESPMDRLTVNLSFGLVLPFPRITITTDSIRAVALAEKNGPIQATSLLEITLYVMKYIPAQRVFARVDYLPSRIDYSTEVKVPWFLRPAMRSPKFSLGIDANQLTGMRVRSSIAPGAVGIVDGVISDDELAFSQGQFELNNSWIWADSDENLSLFAYNLFDPDSKVELSMTYFDESTGKSKKERYEGKGPEAGYLVSNLPVFGSFKIKQVLNLAERYPYKSGGEIYKALTNPVDLKVSEL